MAADPAQEGETNRTDLLARDPYALHPLVAVALDADFCEGEDDPRLEAMDDGRHVGFAFEVPMHHRIDDELARSMPRQSAATVGACGGVVGGRGMAFVAGARAYGDDLRMLNEDDQVLALPTDALLLALAHQRIRDLPRGYVEAKDIHLAHGQPSEAS